MAKTTPGLQQALKSVRQLGRQMTRENNADYKVALSASAAGQANLAKQTQRLTRGLVLGQRQNVLAVKSLAHRARAGVAETAERQQDTVQRYGAALGASVGKSYAEARQSAESSARTTIAASRAAGRQKAIAGTVAGIAAQGVAAQQAAAEYSLNQALMARNAVSAETLAGLTGQLYQTAMEYNQQWEMWKKQQNYALKQAKKQEDKAALGIASVLPELAPQIGLEAYRALDDAEDINAVNITELTSQWATSMGYDPAGSEAGLYAATLRNLLAQGRDPTQYDTNAALQASINQLFGRTKGWDEAYGAAVRSSVDAGTTTAFTSFFGATQDQSGGGEVGNYPQSDPGVLPGGSQTANMRAMLKDAKDRGFSREEVLGQLGFQGLQGFTKAQVDTLLREAGF